MYKYVVAFLLINTFYCSFGLPLTINETLGNIGKSLQLLADSCQNTFLSSQIKNHIDACDITLSAEQDIKETELECLIFYDINSQLCSELIGSKLNLNETFETEVKQTQHVDTICAGASANWKFSNLSLYPKYYNTTQKVFKTSSICPRACGPEILLSEDTNFFCKYYQWGTKLLQQTSTETIASGISGAAPIAIETAPSVPSSSTSQNSLQAQSVNELSQPDNVQEHSQAQLEVPKYPVQNNLDNTVHEKLPENNARLSNKNSEVPKPGDSKDSQLSAATQVNSAKNNTEKPLVPKDLSPPKKLNEDPKSAKDNQVDDVGDNDDGVLYDSGDPLDDAQLQRAPASDDNDPGLEPEPKVKDEKKSQHKQPESIASIDLPGAQKEIYTSTMSEQFGEVDDHFFSFFLTATILVIFFYVLYHNKSKFRKVFLGLLVEGRQPGRRRNSRGHEYRRLDTLEQAMSTNSTAPPSKIIY